MVAAAAALLARFGYNRDGKSGKLQIVFGLLCSTEGCPVAVEVFEGNVGDPSTLASQIAKLKERFELERVVLVDRSDWSRSSCGGTGREPCAAGWSVEHQTRARCPPCQCEVRHLSRAI